MPKSAAVVAFYRSPRGTALVIGAHAIAMVAVAIWGLQIMDADHPLPVTGVAYVFLALVAAAPYLWADALHRWKTTKDRT